MFMFVALVTLTPAAVVPVPQLFAWQRALAGMTAYCAATLISSPVDVIKCRMQLKEAGQQRAIMPLVVSMAKKEGPLIFFAGIGPALLMAPAAVVQYTLIDPLRDVMPLVAAAVIAGTLDIMIKCPFERLKTQMQSGEKTSMTLLLRSTWEANGVRGLWAGLGATLARDIPYLVLKWLTYVYAQGLIGGLVAGLSTQTINLAAGALAGAVAATAVTPMDVIKTRLQVDNNKDATPLTVGGQILAEEGAFGFFRGIGPRLARIPVYTSITLATFDFVKDFFLHAQAGGMKVDL